MLASEHFTKWTTLYTWYFVYFWFIKMSIKLYMHSNIQNVDVDEKSVLETLKINSCGRPIPLRYVWYRKILGSLTSMHSSFYFILPLILVSLNTASFLFSTLVLWNQYSQNIYMVVYINLWHTKYDWLSIELITWMKKKKKKTKENFMYAIAAITRKWYPKLHNNFSRL